MHSRTVLHNCRKGLRFFNVFGEGENETGQYASIATQFLKSKERGEPLIVYGNGSQARDSFFQLALSLL